MNYYDIFDDIETNSTKDTTMNTNETKCTVEWCDEPISALNRSYCNRHRVMADNGEIKRTSWDDRAEMDKIFGKDTRGTEETVVRGEYTHDRMYSSLSDNPNILGPFRGKEYKVSDGW